MKWLMQVKSHIFYIHINIWILSNMGKHFQIFLNDDLWFWLLSYAVQIFRLTMLAGDKKGRKWLSATSSLSQTLLYFLPQEYCPGKSLCVLSIAWNIVLEKLTLTTFNPFSYFIVHVCTVHDFPTFRPVYKFINVHKAHCQNLIPTFAWQ